MKQWLTKELATLAGISVRTLHYYDKIGLLTPSHRQNNDYRLYSEKDLAKLQQIIALKYFGFELQRIKALMTKEHSALESFKQQIAFLRDKGQSLLDAAELLEQTTIDCSEQAPPSWENIIQSIEVYNMTMQLEDNWVKDIFNQKELKEYAEFEAKMKKNSTAESKKAFEDAWYQLVSDIKEHLGDDPLSDIGCELGGRCMTLINNLYGPEYAHLRTKKFERGFGEGKGLEEHGLNPDIVDWLDKAIDIYWHRRAQAVLADVNTLDDSVVLANWQGLMEEIYGRDKTRMSQLVDVVLEAKDISDIGKEWLQRMHKSNRL